MPLKEELKHFAFQLAIAVDVPYIMYILDFNKFFFTFTYIFDFKFNFLNLLLIFHQFLKSNFLEKNSWFWTKKLNRKGLKALESRGMWSKIISSIYAYFIYFRTRTIYFRFLVSKSDDQEVPLKRQREKIRSLLRNC